MQAFRLNASIGALVLAQSLGAHGAKLPLVALVTEDSVNSASIKRLKRSFDVVSVDRIVTPDVKRLEMMGRPELNSTFTKIVLWKQVQFKKILYLDADTLCLRSPEKLLDLDVDFAAGPDQGYPDCFNSGVMLLKPDLAVFESLNTLAQAGSSFDGGDQGLLNQHFVNYHRLPFAYNLQLYKFFRLNMPAAIHFRDDRCIAHFLGKDKPWTLDRSSAPVDESEYSKFFLSILGQWWLHHDALESE